MVGAVEYLKAEDYSPNPPFSVTTADLSQLGGFHGSDQSPIGFFPAIDKEKETYERWLQSDPVWPTDRLFERLALRVSVACMALLAVDNGRATVGNLRSSAAECEWDYGHYLNEFVQDLDISRRPSDVMGQYLRALFRRYSPSSDGTQPHYAQFICSGDSEHVIRGIVEGHILAHGFAAEDEYSDCLGGTIRDFFRNEDRISCIVSNENVQLLAYLRGEFFEAVLERDGTARVRIVEVIEDLFCDVGQQST